jgi:hypothetical protein
MVKQTQHKSKEGWKSKMHSLSVGFSVRLLWELNYFL